MICPRTFAVNQPGVPRQGVDHHFAYTGRVPNTGQLRCTLCGVIKERLLSTTSASTAHLAFSNYRKKDVQPMRPYVPGEDMTNVSIALGMVPAVGGMIAVNPRNPLDVWYVDPAYFAANYVAA